MIALHTGCDFFEFPPNMVMICRSYSVKRRMNVYLSCIYRVYYVISSIKHAEIVQEIIDIFK